MLYGLGHYLRLLKPRRKVQKNIIALILSFPAAGLLVFFLLNPLESVRPIRSLSSKNDQVAFFRRSISHNVYIPAKLNKGKYVIHLWMHGKRMTRRFLRSYGKRLRNPYQFCSVNNCVVSTNDSRVSEADAVMFHLHRTKGPHELPKHRSPHQMWIFFTDESPHHTFLASRKYTMPDYNGIFNWSMTYRMDSDIPVPYGRTIRLTTDEANKIDDLPNFAHIKNRTVAILGSNCGGRNYRWDYVHELQNYIEVDVYGRCGKFKCAGHFDHDCGSINQYKFYLAFENSNCREYFTEKLWWNAYQKNSVPIVMGAPKEDYEKLCPPNSFIHVEDFQSPFELAQYINYLDTNDTAYNDYFKWKKKYKVINEHGYFGSSSFHLCHICEKLNNKTFQPKSYNDLSSFWNWKTDCFEPKWKPQKG